jgi:uncharacterized membrane protein
MITSVLRLAIVPVALASLVVGAPTAGAAQPYQLVKLTKVAHPFNPAALNNSGLAAGSFTLPSGEVQTGVYNLYSKKSKTLTAYAQSTAYDVNSHGEVTGGAVAGGRGVAFVWDAVHGTTRTLKTPKAPAGMRVLEAAGMAINDHGKVAGEYTYTPIDGDGEEQYSKGVLWKANGHPVVISQLDAAVAINRRGDVVGTGGASGWLRRAGGGVVQLPGPSATPTSINDAGRIAGTVLTGVGSHAVLWKARTLRRCDLEQKATGSSVALEINDSGRVVASRSADPLAGKLYRTVIWNGCGAKPTVLPDDAGAQSLPAGFNDRGDVIGTHYTDANAPLLWTRHPGSKV